MFVSIEPITMDYLSIMGFHFLQFPGPNFDFQPQIFNHQFLSDILHICVLAMTEY